MLLVINLGTRLIFMKNSQGTSGENFRDFVY